MLSASFRRSFAVIVLALMASGVGAAAVGRPNILFAISDDQSWPHAGAYGCRFVQTPAFDRVARDGVLFRNAFACAPQCSPNRASILTGRHIWQNEEAGVHASNFPRKLQVFTDGLEAAGYSLGTTGKTWGPGNWQVTGWPRNPAGPGFNRRSLKPPASGVSKNDYAANFAEFLAQKPADRPFFFWYGAHEPHRSYQAGIGRERGGRPADVTVPGFLPDTPEIREDLLDYAFEINWFDTHLGRMLAALEARGELANTLVVVTSDNGMPFPRAKANLYEHGIHMPLAVMWPARVRAGRVVADFVSFTDFAPTFLAAAHAVIPAAMTGRSFLDVLLSAAAGQVDPQRTRALSGRERHTHARPDNLAYPARSLRTARYLYIWNAKPDRWPAGDPTGAGGEGYFDIDGSPSKTFFLTHRAEYPRLVSLALDRRPEHELYDVQRDPACLENLAGDAAQRRVLTELRAELQHTLRVQGDPRVTGHGDIFESYPRYSHMRSFPGFKEQGAYNPAYQQ